MSGGGYGICTHTEGMANHARRALISCTLSSAADRWNPRRMGDMAIIADEAPPPLRRPKRCAINLFGGE